MFTPDAVADAVRAALPRIRITGMGPITEGFENDRCRVSSSEGELMVKITRAPRPSGIVPTQRRIQQLLAAEQFNSPECLHFGPLEPEPDADGQMRTIDVQRHIAGTELSLLLGNPRYEDRAVLLGRLGDLTGKLHAIIDPQVSDRWHNVHWTTADSWYSAMLPEQDAAHIVSADPSLRDTIAAAMRQIEHGLTSLPEPTRAIAHSDLHAGNVLVAPSGQLILFDFEFAHQWDGAWDLASDLYQTISSPDGRRHFLPPYLDRANLDQDTLASRVWLYRGIHLLHRARDYYDGDDYWKPSLAGLIDWTTSIPSNLFQRP